MPEQITNINELKEVITLCKGGAFIFINDHKNNYETVEQNLEDDRLGIEPEVFAEMVKTDTIIRVQVYPHTPIGFYLIYHYDIEAAIKLALQSLKDESFPNK